jgi:hypothetical protein
LKRVNDTSFWDQRRGRIFSKKGGWRIGQGILNHGYSMMDDLVGKVSYMQVVMLNATGRLPERRMADWIEAIHICLSWPDPRIWCNQIGALSGSIHASAVASVAAGLMALDSRAYGTRPIIEGMRFIKDAVQQYNAGASVSEIIARQSKGRGGKPQIIGYARPIAKGDERIVAMERVTEALGFEIGPHMKLAYQIGEVLVSEHDESMNINGYGAAFMADHGYSEQETYQLISMLGASGITACYVNEVDSVPDSFLPLRCDDIDYEGKPFRDLP